MKRILFIGAHQDDIEISCGGTINRMLQDGFHVSALVFSQQYGQLNLSKEFEASMVTAGVQHFLSENYITRYFHTRRQDILEHLYAIRENHDIVFTHDPQDFHPDHSVVGQETIRAFRKHTVLSYCSPFNSVSMQEQYFVSLREENVVKKLEMLSCYKSQQHRAYMNPEVVKAQAITRGLQAATTYAEAFRVIKMIN